MISIKKLNVRKIGTLAAAAALLSFLPALAHARIGETEEQIEARYGKPREIETSRGMVTVAADGDPQSKYYNNSNMQIKIRYNETTKRSEHEEYNGVNQCLSSDAFEALMKANAGEKTWVAKDFSSKDIDKCWNWSSDYNMKVWWLDDGSICAIAYYRKEEKFDKANVRILRFMTKEFAKADYEQRLKDLRDAERRKAMEKF